MSHWQTCGVIQVPWVHPWHSGTQLFRVQNFGFCEFDRFDDELYDLLTCALNLPQKYSHHCMCMYLVLYTIHCYSCLSKMVSNVARGLHSHHSIFELSRPPLASWALVAFFQPFDGLHNVESMHRDIGPCMFPAPDMQLPHFPLSVYCTFNTKVS